MVNDSASEVLLNIIMLEQLQLCLGTSVCTYYKSVVYYLFTLLVIVGEWTAR